MGSEKLPTGEKESSWKIKDIIRTAHKGHTALDEFGGRKSRKDILLSRNVVK